MLSQTIKTRGRHVSIRFAPPAIFDKLHKQQFQAKSSEGFDWRRQEYAEQMWQLMTPRAEGEPRSQLKLSLRPDLLSFEDFFPIDPMELYTDNLRLAMESVSTVFSPAVMIGIGVVVRYTAEADGGDARLFLGNRCLRLDDRLGALNRPLHAVGLKLLMPPIPGEGKPNWQAELKIESLIEDVRQLYIEVDARWGEPCPWKADAVVERLNIANDFGTGQVIKLLQDLAR
jgi:hypothetical protein